MKGAQGKKTPSKDRKLYKIYKAQKAEAGFRLATGWLGIVMFVGLWVADVYFSYEPARAILPGWLSLILAVITTPIELIGTDLVSENWMKQGTAKWVIYAWDVVFVLALVYDVGTNIWGLWSYVEPRTVNPWLIWSIPIGIGLLMAFIEYGIQFAIKFVAGQRAALGEASRWLEASGYDDNIVSVLLDKHEYEECRQ